MEKVISRTLSNSERLQLIELNLDYGLIDRKVIASPSAFQTMIENIKKFRQTKTGNTDFTQTPHKSMDLGGENAKIAD